MIMTSLIEAHCVLGRVRVAVTVSTTGEGGVVGGGLSQHRLSLLSEESHKFKMAATLGGINKHGS